MLNETHHAPPRYKIPEFFSSLLEFSIDPQRKVVPTLDALRKKRNVGSYEDYGLVSQGEADRCGKMAIRVRKEIEEWIRKNHGDKIPVKPATRSSQNSSD
jgi:hypothetical protein